MTPMCIKSFPLVIKPRLRQGVDQGVDLPQVSKSGIIQDEKKNVFLDFTLDP